MPSAYRPKLVPGVFSASNMAGCCPPPTQWKKRWERDCCRNQEIQSELEVQKAKRQLRKYLGRYGPPNMQLRIIHKFRNTLKYYAHAYQRPRETLAVLITNGSFCKCDSIPQKQFNDKFLLSNHRCLHHRRGHWDRQHLRLSGIQRAVRYWIMWRRGWNGKNMTRRGKPLDLQRFHGSNYFKTGSGSID